VPSAEQIEPELPDGVDEVLTRALAKDPAARPASCAELVADLADTFRNAEAATRVLPPLLPTRAEVEPERPRALHRPRRRRTKILVLGALALALAGVGLAALLGSTLDSGEGAERTTRPPISTTTEITPPTTVTETTTATETTSPPTTAPSLPTTTEITPPATTPANGVALNNEGFALMQDGDYAGALPLLERAVAALSGSGSLSEAYASYNLAFTRFTLGECDGVLSLLERSEGIQGKRREIDRLSRQASKDCGDDEKRDD